MFKIAVLASTKGTDLQAIINAIKSKKLKVELSCVISNKEKCLALKRSRDEGFKAYFVDPKGKIREEFDLEVAELLEEYEVDLIVLVGYMRILSKEFVQRFKNKIINVHPALIPAFCGPNYFGKSVHEEVLKRGVKVTGCTIHFLNEECDAGPIILQKTAEVEENDTPDTLKEKVQSLEKKWYPEVIKWISKGKVRVEDGKVKIKK